MRVLRAARQLSHRIRRRHPWRFVPGFEFHGSSQYASRVCDLCELIEPVGTPGHPESLVAILSPAEEDYLAWLDAESWPEDADIDDCADALERIFPADDISPGEAA